MQTKLQFWTPDGKFLIVHKIKLETNRGEEHASYIYQQRLTGIIGSPLPQSPHDSEKEIVKVS